MALPDHIAEQLAPQEAVVMDSLMARPSQSWGPPGYQPVEPEQDRAAEAIFEAYKEGFRDGYRSTVSERFARVADTFTEHRDAIDKIVEWINRHEARDGNDQDPDVPQPV